MDYYRVLELSRDAMPKEIKKAYRKLALKYHPDVNRNDPACEENFKNITEAYGVLIDPEKRRIYDRDYRGDFKREQVFHDIFTRPDFRDVFDDLPLRREWIDRLFNVSKVIAYEALVYGGKPGDILRRSLFRLAAQSASKIFHNVMDIHEEIRIPPEIAAQGGYITIEYRPGFSIRRIRINIPKNIKSGTVLRITGMGRKNFRKKAGDLYLHTDIESS